MKIKINPTYIKNAKMIVKTVGGYISDGAKILVPIIGLGIVSAYTNNRTNTTTNYWNWDDPFNFTSRSNDRSSYFFDHPSYATAIESIVKSDMPSSYRNEAVEYIRRDETDDYYSAVISISESDMCSSYKCESIKKL